MKWKPPIPFKPIRNHHLYYGIAFFIFGLYNYLLMIGSNEMLSLGKFWILLMIIGIITMIDDIIEHTVTASTPLRILFEKCILPFIKR